MRDLAQIRVSGALAHPVDRPVDPGCAGAHGCGRAGGGDAEVVVAVEVHGRAVEPLDRLPDEVTDRLGRGDPERVDDGDLARAGLDGGLVDPPEELGSARVESTPKNAAWMSCSAANRIAAAIRSSIFSRERRSRRASGRRSATRSPSARRRAETSASRSAGTAREKPHTSAFSPASEISCTACQSSSETRGKPASIRSIPSSSSSRAISSFCCGSSTTPTVCSPSRSVVSYRPTRPPIA